MTVKTPCPPDCPTRSGDCHTNCPTYLAAFQENLKRYKQKAKDRVLDEIRSESIRRRMQKKSRKRREV